MSGKIMDDFFSDRRLKDSATRDVQEAQDIHYRPLEQINQMKAYFLNVKVLNI